MKIMETLNENNAKRRRANNSKAFRGPKGLLKGSFKGKALKLFSQGNKGDFPLFPWIEHYVLRQRKVNAYV